MNGASVTTNAGSIVVEGRGGNDSGGGQRGVVLQNGAVFQAGGSGTVMVTGTGGASSGSPNQGVFVLGTGTKITSNSGNVTVVGNAGGTSGSFNAGVDVGGGQITAGGSGNVSVTGMGATASGIDNHGVVLRSGGVIDSSGGDVEVIGTGGGTGSSSGNEGVVVAENNSRISAAGSGTVTVCGTGGTGTGGSNDGVRVWQVGALISSSGGDILICGNKGDGPSSVAVQLEAGGRIKTTNTIPPPPTAGDVRINAAGNVVSGGTSRIVANALGIEVIGSVFLGDVDLGVTANSVNELAVNTNYTGSVEFLNQTPLLGVDTVSAATSGCCSFLGVDGVHGTSVKVENKSILLSDPAIEVRENVTGSLDITLTAGDSAATGDNLTVKAGVTVRSTGGNVTLRAGDDLFLEDGSTVAAPAGTVTLEGDFGDADPGAGSLLSLLGTITSSAQATALGGPDSDSIILNPGAAQTADSILLNGAAGDDFFDVFFGRLTGGANAVDIADSGDSDRATVNGTSAAETINVHNNDANGVNPQTGGQRREHD